MQIRIAAGALPQIMDLSGLIVPKVFMILVLAVCITECSLCRMVQFYNSYCFLQL